MTTAKPRNAREVEEVVRWALGEGKSLEIVGHGSKRALGRPAQTDATLDLSALAGVTLYEPEELVLSAKAGTPIAEIEALLESRGQALAFEPMDLGPLLGGALGAGTIGGVLAANLGGPRRIKAGAARDHFLGFSAVSGRGETFKAGGRVVKNVTGYDLSKLMAGSFGTLAAMTDVTVKTLPRAETEATVLVLGLDEARAVAAMAAAMGSSCEVSGAAHLPEPIALRASDDMPVGHSVTALRLEGVAPSVEHRRNALAELMKPFGPLSGLNEAQSRALWRAIRDVIPFAASATQSLGVIPGEPAGRGPESISPVGEYGFRARGLSPAPRNDGGTSSEDRHVWRISTAPSKGAELARLIGARADAEFLYDWAGGLVWAALAPADDAGASTVRTAIAQCGGHATLMRAPAAVRAAVAVFEPQPGPLAALSKRVKESFDPNGVLNPGRMWAGV
jgi:glycolate oxidase FAD binding subunit